ncbi:MAG: uracil-DNA glycosylase [Erysipelotrichales bacterium]|nr:uracil-DNA glycosylase [Erysipelotrichales bacterium]
MIKTWEELFLEIKQKDYAKRINQILSDEYAYYVVYPPRKDMFKAFQLTPLENVKVVIIGQDPYHEENQAMGLSFSVPNGVALPPSLINIYKEIENNFGIKMKNNGDLTYLAKQGVLLLNTILSVRKSTPLSHQNIGYDKFVQDVLSAINEQKQPIVFMLWGSYARSLKKYLNNPNHLILESTHPSPLSANRGGFFNQYHFLKANKYLKDHGLSEINWQN